MAATPPLGKGAKPVLIGSQDAVGIITLNRPDRLNAWTGQMERHYFDALTTLAADSGVKAIVVTGAGRGFCAGADMSDLDDHATSGPKDVAGERPQTFPLTIGKPIIAAINGPCAGIGLVQALMCDLRFAVEGAKLTTSFAKLGLIAEHGTSWLLAKHVGIGNALDLLLSARVVRSEEALRMGLVNRVCPDGTVVEEAIAYGQMLATTVSPAAMSIIKAQVYEHYNVALASALEKSNALMSRTLEQEDFREGVRSFIDERAPVYRGLSLSPASTK